MCEFASVHAYACMYVRRYVRIHTYMCVHIYMYMHMVSPHACINTYNFKIFESLGSFTGYTDDAEAA